MSSDALFESIDWYNNLPKQECFLVLTKKRVVVMCEQITSVASPLARWQVFTIMFLWLTKKRIYKQIKAYGKDQEILLKLAHFTLATEIGDITLDHIKDFYQKEVCKHNSHYLRAEDQKSIRKWFKTMFACGEKCLRPEYIKDDPLNTVVKISTIVPMTKNKVGRPRNEEAVLRVKHLKDNEGLSFRDIAYHMKKDSRQVQRWYRYKIGKPVDSLSTG